MSLSSVHPAPASPRFGLTAKFNVVFVVILLLAGINIVSVRALLAEGRGVAETVNIAGKLRMLSQKLAFETTLALHDHTNVAVHSSVVATMADYEAALAALEHGGVVFGLEVPAVAADKRPLTTTLRSHWQAYRALLERLLDNRGDTSRLGTLQTQAALLLDTAETLVGELTRAHSQAQQRTLHGLYALAAVEVLIIGLLIALVRLRLVSPLVALAQATRALLDKRYDHRVQFQSRDEIGELVSSFNSAAGHIGDLVSQIEHIATHDALTGLGNRNLLADHLRLAIASSKRSGRGFAVLLLDLNDFKVINDSLGHSTGDRLLQLVAQRLQQSIREGDTVARFGGDEFVIVLPDVDDASDAAIVAEKIHALLTAPFVIDGHELFAHVSVGIALYPQDTAQDGDAEALIKHADLAMYRAKREFHVGYRFYSEEFHEHNQRRLDLARDLHHAIADNALFLEYQPKVCLRTGRIDGVEALLRWQHPQLGRIPPLDFIPLAEDTGMIIAIGEWVIEQACAQLRSWQDAGLALRSVAVNVSGKQLRSRALPEFVLSTLTRFGLQPKQLEIELTESVLMDQHEDVLTAIHHLRDAGVSLAMDDFGTGYSSLSYLKQFPFDHLKLDKSFIDGVNVSRRDTAIVQSVLALGRAFGLHTVAEGVETRAQLEFLLAHGCEQAQGYLFSAPLPPEQLAELLTARTIFALTD